MCKFLEYIKDIFTSDSTEISKVNKTDQECVICLEQHSIFHPVYNISRYIDNRKCSCTYYVHDSCLLSWYNNNRINMFS